MSLSIEGVTSQSLTLPEELLLMLLSPESGYVHQVPGWALYCAVVGAVLAELSLISRIDTDLESLFLLDETETGDPALDPVLKEIAAEPVQRNAQYWIERLAPLAESIIDVSLNRLVEQKILEYHDGDFWTLARNERTEGAAFQFVTTRISNVLFQDEIPDPRDVIIICLVNTCDVFRFMFQLDDETEERIQFICKLDLIGRSIAEAVSQNLAGPLLRRSALTKKIPVVPLRHLLLNPHVRDGNLPALFADLAQQHGPVFELRPPFSKPMICLAGPDTNRWAHRRGRMYLRAKDYLEDFEKVYGASGILPALDGADHFRFRKSMRPAYSRGRLEGQLNQLYHHARAHMANWAVGDSFPAVSMCRQLINAELSPLALSVYSQDIISDLSEYKVRALMTHVVNVLPKFMLRTPGMRRRAKSVDTLLRPSPERPYTRAAGWMSSGPRG